jgi:hypothetical protein
MSECIDPTLQSLHSFLVETIQNNTISSPQRPIGNKLPWVDDEVISEMRHRDYLGSFRRLRSSDDDMRNRERILKNQKNKVTDLIRANKFYQQPSANGYW